MMRRWRTIVDPEARDEMRPPTAGEAAALWFLGSAWLAYGAFLAFMGLPVWLPAVPVVGLVGLWGWKRRGWWFGFPAAAVVATLGDARIEGVTTMHLLDLLMVGLALMVIARRMVRGWGRRPFRSWEGLKYGSLLLGAGLAVVDPLGALPRELRIAAAAGLAATAAHVAGRYGIARLRVRMVFPVVAFAFAFTTLWSVVSRGAPTSSPYTVGSLLLMLAVVPFLGPGSVPAGHGRRVMVVVAVLTTLAVGIDMASLATVGRTGGVFSGRLPVLVTALVVVAAAAFPGGMRIGSLTALRVRCAVSYAACMWVALAGDPRLMPTAVVVASTAFGLALGGRRSRSAVVVPFPASHPQEASCERRSA